MKEIKRGDIFYADLSTGVGSEQSGVRPVIIISNDIGNMISPTVVVTAVTSQNAKWRLPTHVYISADGLKKCSIALLEQLRTIDKSRLLKRIAHLDYKSMQQIGKALAISIGLTNMGGVKDE